MANKFHIGIRIDEIMIVGATKSDQHPTEYTLRNGTTVRSTGKWHENVAKIEELLAAESIDASELEFRKAEVERAKRELEAIQRFVNSLKASLPTSEPLGEIASALLPVLRGERSYLRAAEVTAIFGALHSMGVQV